MGSAESGWSSIDLDPVSRRPAVTHAAVRAFSPIIHIAEIAVWCKFNKEQRHSGLGVTGQIALWCQDNLAIII